MIADELRRQADAFIDLDTLRTKIERDPSTRSVARKPNELDASVARRPVSCEPVGRDGGAQSQRAQWLVTVGTGLCEAGSRSIRRDTQEASTRDAA
jgi:hypothetical protein